MKVSSSVIVSCLDRDVALAQRLLIFQGFMASRSPGSSRTRGQGVIHSGTVYCFAKGTVDGFLSRNLMLKEFHYHLEMGLQYSGRDKPNLVSLKEETHELG